jgi:hypothetical protein
VHFSDANNGTATGTGGAIVRSTNGGVSWHSQSSGTESTLRSVAFTDADSGTAVGNAGVIVRTTTGGVTTVGEYLNPPVATDFVLMQNYPNPFNPATTISFSIPSKSFVSLNIFDALGREVSSLLSEELSAGKYSQQWDAAGLSSGVYFYRLQAGSFVETKKLLVVR